jgi:aryl-alcohol dehydrogenase-like predicted oxidoreductase
VKKVNLGSNLLVSRLCFGTEPFAIKKGPDGMKTQGDLSPVQGGNVLRDALHHGVNFWDTSDDYGTHPHVKVGLGLVERNAVVVADKSNALSYEEGEKAVESSLSNLETEYIDLMLLHNVPLMSFHRRDTSGRPYESGNLERRRGALDSWYDAKESGLVRALGISTHSTGVLKQVLDVPEIEVVCTTLNMNGMFIEDGSIEEHIDAIAELHDSGKGIYVIKILQAGRLKEKAEEAIKFALKFHDYIDSWNIGMYDMGDVSNNLRLFTEALGG